jgi:hypothetical protein
MNLEHATPELFAALAKAQNAVENAHKGSLNPHFKNRYADLAEVLNTVRPVFSECGLSIVQETSFDGSLVSVTTALCHEKGGYVDLDVVNYCVSVDDDYEDDNWILQYQVDPGDHGKNFKLPILRYSDYEYRLLISLLGESMFEELLGKWFTETYGWPVNSVTPEQD